MADSQPSRENLNADPNPAGRHATQRPYRTPTAGETARTGSSVPPAFGTLRDALWIGGGQWAGKSTVARILALRHGLTAYHYDYQDARGHDDRRVARRVRLGEPPAGRHPMTSG
jgi:hypothetical protein